MPGNLPCSPFCLNSKSGMVAFNFLNKSCSSPIIALIMLYDIFCLLFYTLDLLSRRVVCSSWSYSVCTWYWIKVCWVNGQRINKLAYLSLKSSILEENAAFTCFIAHYLVSIIRWQHISNTKRLTICPWTSPLHGDLWPTSRNGPFLNKICLDLKIINYVLWKVNRFSSTWPPTKDSRFLW